MIYITNADGNGDPCIEIKGFQLRVFHCKDEISLYESLINLLRTSSGNFEIMNAYGQVIPIPNDHTKFIINQPIKEFLGKIVNNDPAKVIKTLKPSSLRLRVNLAKRVVYAKLLNEINAEELITNGIAILKPIRIPNVKIRSKTTKNEHNT